MKAALIVTLCTLAFATEVHAARRALLIGINDYTASRLGRPSSTAPPRDWRNLQGAVNDVELLEQLLGLLYGVDQRDIVTLTDQAATRAAILQALETLSTTVSKDDIVFVYFAGHGSRVKNSRSQEADKLDEAIVPADSRLGVEDIRDKQLATYFNRILDRGARLTALLDNCFSGSGARGLGIGMIVRGITTDPRDVRDGVRYGTPPEERGALILSAAEDGDFAREVRDADGKFHGVFTWAWIRALSRASADEPAGETFRRAQAYIRVEMPFQSPVIAGLAEVKRAPFLGSRIDRRLDRAVVAISKATGDSTVLEGGWANGLAVGTELKETKTSALLKITMMLGPGRSVAQVLSGPAPTPGSLAEVVGWAAPPGRPLRVSTPRIGRSTAEIARFARKLKAEAIQQGIRWVVNPLDSPTSHVLRWRSGTWEFVGPGGTIERLGGDDAAIAAVAKLPPATSLFAQLPAPAPFVAELGTESVEQDDADYILVGRYSRTGLSYAWIRPLVKRSDLRKSALPLQTKWRNPVADLRLGLLRLRRIHSWQTLESPPQARFPYDLQIRRKRDGLLVGEGESIAGNEDYILQLRGRLPRRDVEPRSVYVMVIDSNGKGTLIFPNPSAGSVENRYGTPPPDLEITLPGAEFKTSEPYGIDTYILLSTDEPLPNCDILSWEGVRTAKAPPKTALEQLLVLTATGARSRLLVTPASWSIERIVHESIPPHATKSTR